MCAYDEEAELGLHDRAEDESDDGLDDPRSPMMGGDQHHHEGVHGNGKSLTATDRNGGRNGVRQGATPNGANGIGIKEYDETIELETRKTSGRR